MKDVFSQIKNIKIDKDLIEGEYCKRSFYFFFQRAWAVLEPATPLDLNWHHEAICDVVQLEFERWLRKEKKTKDIVINIPPRSTKSLIINVCFPVWCWINEPAMRIISSSYSMTLSVRQTVKSRTLIESNWFQRLFGDSFKMKKDENQKSFYANENTGIRMATATGASLTGEGANCFIYDDTMNPDIARSQAERERSIDWYKETSYSRLNDQEIDFRIIIEQRLHERDLSGYVLETDKDNWRHICLPAELSNDTSPEYRDRYQEGLFWKKRFSFDTLRKTRNALGEYGYAGQYQQRPAPAEGGIFKRSYFDRITAIQFAKLTENKKYIVNFDADTAYTKNKENDASGVMASTQIDNLLYVLWVDNVYMEFPDFIKFLKEFVHRHNYSVQSKIRIEPKANGLSIIQQLRRETKLNVVGDSMSKAESQFFSQGKETRANAASPTVEAKRVVLVEGPWVEAFLNQVCMFPNANNDECVDILVQAVYYNFMGNQNKGYSYLK